MNRSVVCGSFNAVFFNCSFTCNTACIAAGSCYAAPVDAVWYGCAALCFCCNTACVAALCRYCYIACAARYFRAVTVSRNTCRASQRLRGTFYCNVFNCAAVHISEQTRIAAVCLCLHWLYCMTLSVKCASEAFFAWWTYAVPVSDTICTVIVF